MNIDLERLKEQILARRDMKAQLERIPEKTQCEKEIQAIQGALLVGDGVATMELCPEAVSILAMHFDLVENTENGKFTVSFSPEDPLAPVNPDAPVAPEAPVDPVEPVAPEAENA